jgi:hypothetical protein
MTATVTVHPAFIERRFLELHREVEGCKERLWDVLEGVITPEQAGPEFTTKAEAVDACRIALELAEEDLAKFELEHGCCSDCGAPAGTSCGKRRCPRLTDNMGEPE